MIKIEALADIINKYTDDFKYFWACGLIKETVALWEKSENLELLNETAQNIASYYI